MTIKLLMNEMHAPIRSVMTIARSWLAVRDSIAATDPAIDTTASVKMVRGDQRDTATAPGFVEFIKRRMS